MLNILPVFTLLLIGTTAVSDSAAPEAIETAPQGIQNARMVTAALSFRSYDGFERILMGILAAAAVGFQLRRRYRVSQRAWQRIAPATNSISLEPAPLPRGDRFSLQR